MKKDVAIKVENLSKKYIIGEEHQYLTLREQLQKLPQKFIPKLRLKTTEFWALKNVSFEIKKGEVVGIIGRNGAGKSTLLKILSKIVEPTSGKITMRGKIASLLEVGTGFNPELTGRENIYLSGAIIGMTKKEINKKLNSIIEFSGIDKFIDTPVKRYSSGMYVRLAFAVSAHLDSDILLIDEVLAVGDNEFQKKCLGKMDDLSKSGRTVIFVSHNLNAIRSICKNSIFLTQGEIDFIGPTNKAISQYTSDNNKEKYYKKWEKELRPRNKTTILNFIKILNKDRVIAKELTTDDVFFIQIDYEIIKPTKSGFTILISDDQNNLIFSSINNHEKEWYGKIMKPGKYASFCTIPGQLLNNRKYSIGIVVFGSNFSDANRFENLLSISILDGPKIRKDYYREIAGLIRPKLNWETKNYEKY